MGFAVDQIEVPQLVDSFIKGSFNTTSYYKLISCFAGEVEEVVDLADGALDQAIAMGQTTPWQAFSVATLAFALALLFLGFYLVRIVNFFSGFYLGSSLSLFLISLFAADLPMMQACKVLLGTVTGSALLIAIICVVKRKSMYVLLGLIAGEIIGRFFYHLAIERSGYGTNALYVSIGFFAVVGAYAVKEIGDLAWMVCTALMGAYFTVISLTELVLVPYLPDGKQYAAFLSYRPSGIEVSTITGSQYLWAPIGAIALLTLIGLLTQLACYNKMMRSRKVSLPPPMV